MALVGLQFLFLQNERWLLGVVTISGLSNNIFDGKKKKKTESCSKPSKWYRGTQRLACAWLNEFNGGGAMEWLLSDSINKVVLYGDSFPGSEQLEGICNGFITEEEPFLHFLFESRLLLLLVHLSSR